MMCIECHQSRRELALYVLNKDIKPLGWDSGVSEFPECVDTLLNVISHQILSLFQTTP